MTFKRIYIIKFHRTKQNKCIAFTYSSKEAWEYCNDTRTRGNDWFCGWTTREPTDFSPSTPLLSDLLKDLT
jgi:hypothetical protein